MGITAYSGSKFIVYLRSGIGKNVGIFLADLVSRSSRGLGKPTEAVGLGS